MKAAFRVFSRYGVKRATMNDIAEEAGVARQTLYSLFSGKDDLLRATIRGYADRSIAEIEAECAGLSDLGEKLDVVFRRLVVIPWERIHATPHGDEILTGVRDAARQEIVLADARYGAMLEEMLAHCTRRTPASGPGAKQLCDLMQASWYGIRHKARDREQLLALLASLKALVLHMVESR